LDPKQVSKEVSRKIVRYFIKGRPHLVDDGVGTIIPTLLDGIPSSRIHLNTRVTEVVKAEDGLKIQSDNSNLPADTFDYVVIATNGGVGSIRGTSGGNSRHWNASTTVYHSTRMDLSQFNQLMLGENFTNSLVLSNANPTYSSDSRSLIATTYLGTIDESGWKTVGTEKTSEIASLYGLKSEDLDLVSLQNIPYSLPRFSTSEPRSLSIVDPKDSRIVYAGDAFDEPSQNGAIRSGRVAIEKLLSH
jgi:protoporphyrinogen oxidase